MVHCTGTDRNPPACRTGAFCQNLLSESSGLRWWSAQSSPCLSQEKTDLDTLIAEEKLKPDETRKFVDNSFCDGVLKITGTDVDRILPPVSRFGGGNRAAKKDGIIAKLQAFFDKYFGLV